MDILILTHFTSTFSDTDNDRFLYIAKELSKEHSVEILTSDFCHEKKTHRNKTEKEWPFKVTFLAEKGYPKNVCIRRFYSHFLWGLEVKRYLRNRKKPDVVYCAVPSLTGPYMAAKYCKKNNIRFIIDLQDLWPEAFRMVFHMPIISNIIFMPFRKIANIIYSSANEIVAVSRTYANRALDENQRLREGHVVFLGTELENFDKYVEKEIPLTKGCELWLAYCGTLGSSYDLTCVFDALDIVKKSGIQPPKFIIMGDGPLKARFEEYAKKKDIDAVFMGRLAYDQMCAILSKCDMTVNPIVHGAAQSIINKHADYVASGLPIISTQENQEFKDLIEKYQMGVNCRNNDPSKLAENIIHYCKNEQLRLKTGKNARRCAEEKFDRKQTYREIVSLIVGR